MESYVSSYKLITLLQMYFLRYKQNPKLQNGLNSKAPQNPNSKTTSSTIDQRYKLEHKTGNIFFLSFFIGVWQNWKQGCFGETKN